MPTIRESPTAIVSEWSLDEVSRAYETPAAPVNQWLIDDYFARQEAKIKADYDWYGIRSLNDARQLLTGGWTDGVRRLQNVCAELNPPTAQTRKRRPEWRDEGDELNVDRAIRGDFDRAWRTSRRVWARGPQTIELYSIYGGSAGLSREEIFWNGAACVVLADRLEAAGYRVRIVACFMHTDEPSNRTVRHDVVIKEADEPLRIDGVASVLCHAGVYRTFLFRTWACAPVKLGGGLGPAVYSFTTKAVADFQAAGEWPEGALVVDNAHNREGCIRRIDELMAKIQS